MRILTEKEAEKFLEKNGFAIAESIFVKDLDELGKALKKTGFPVAIKISSKKIIHKHVINGVFINIENLNEAIKKFEVLRGMKDFEEAVIQKMIRGKEIILGLKYTEEFGLVIMIGAGGTKAEKIKDTSFRVCPITAQDAENMVKELKIYPEIKNKTGLIKKNLILLSDVAKKYPSIRELDINPLMLEKKAVVVDARLSL